MADTFEDIIRQSIKSFKKGKMPEETKLLLEEEGGEVKYTPEYFDELEEELLDQKEKTDKKEAKKSKGKKKPKEMSEGGTPSKNSPGVEFGVDAMKSIAGIGGGISDAYTSAAANTDKSKFVTQDPPRRR
jgi:hypothetical protein